jgi:hypothetical protein
MLTPAVTASTTYYKIGDEVTFGWNYTSLIVTPSAIDVLVSCSTATYTIASNMSAKAMSVKWNTSEDMSGADALGTNYYTLAVFDAGQPVTAIPKAGYLSSFNQFRFGMYLPQPYTPLSGQAAPSRECSRGPAANALGRFRVCYLQRSRVEPGTADPRVPLRDGGRHGALLHLVHRRLSRVLLASPGRLLAGRLGRGIFLMS